MDKRTRENIAACQAVGLSFWAEHPKPAHLWAVDDRQQPHVVKINRRESTAHVCEETGYVLDADEGEE